MTISVRCDNPSCHKTLKIKEQLAGKKLKCPACGRSFTATPHSAAHPDPHAHHEKTPTPRAPVVSDTDDDEEGGAMPWPWIVAGTSALGLICVVIWMFLSSSSAARARAESEAAHAEANLAKAETEKLLADITKTKEDATAMAQDVAKLKKETAAETADFAKAKADLATSLKDADAAKKEIARLNQELTKAKAALDNVKVETPAKDPPPDPKPTPQPAKAFELDKALYASGREKLREMKYSPIGVYANSERPGSIQLAGPMIAEAKDAIALLDGASLENGKWDIRKGDVFFNVGKAGTVRVGTDDLRPGESTLFNGIKFSRLDVFLGEEKPFKLGPDELALVNSHTKPVTVTITDVKGSYTLKPKQQVALKLSPTMNYTVTVVCEQKASITFAIKATPGSTWRVRTLVPGQGDVMVLPEGP